MKKLFLALLLACATIVQAQTINQHKLSHHLSALAKSQPQGRHILALMKLAGQDDIHAVAAEQGFQVVDSVGRIYIVRIPVRQLATLAHDRRIYRIEAERMPRAAMDVTPGQVDATSVYAGTGLPQAFTGKNVAAGVFDCGFDFTHPAFMDADGQLRVKYYYDFLWPNQDGTLGHALNTTEEIAEYGHSQHVFSSLHGTHVMGIMAGSAVGGKYQGMAPESDIYVADFNSLREDFSNPDEETSAVAVLGFKYLFDAAQKDGKPCVVNFSSCESITLAHQRELEAEALLALVGPGRIIVAAAGNDGFRTPYLEKPEGVLRAGSGIINGVGSGQLIYMDLVTPGNQQVRFDFLGMKLMGGGIEGTIIFNTDSIDSLQGDTCHLTTTVSSGEVKLSVYASDYQDPRGRVYHIDGELPFLGYLVLNGATCLLTSDSPAWMYADVFYSPFTNVTGAPAYCYAKDGYSVSWPATLDGVISVGATGYKSTVRNIDGDTYTGMLSFAPDADGHITTFSSRGPTFDGRIKPTVVAPGLNINAAFNSFVDISDNIRKELTDRITYNGKTYYYTAQSGTSMASPVVAGAIALWLQAKPDLTPEEITDVIAHTATIPDATMDYPNNTYGHGQIDVYKGLLYVLNLETAIHELSDHQPQQATFRLEGRRLYIDGSVQDVAITSQQPQRQQQQRQPEVTVFSLDGKPLLRQRVTRYIDLTALPAGVYAVQLNTGKKETTGSTLIRL